MSLEDKIEKLTAAIEKQTALIEKGVAKASTGPAAAAAAAKPAAAAAAAKPAAAKPAGKPAAKPKHPTEEELREKFGGYLTSVSDKAGKRALTETVKPILEHFGVERVTEIPEEHRAEAMEYCDLLIAGYEADGLDGAGEVHLPFMQDDGAEEGDGDEGVL
jgi:hypothetical protein